MSNCYQSSSKPKQSSFVVPSWQTRDAPTNKSIPLDPVNEEWRDRAFALHAAKKRATTSFSRVANQPKDYRAQETWAEEERAVLRTRAGLLNTLMASREDPKLCLPAEHSPKRVCVTYNRVRCEADGQVQLGPMQSTMSWVVHGGETAMQSLLLADGPGPLGLLLGAIRRSMPPGKEALKALDRALRLPLPDRLDKRPTASPDQTRAMQGGAFHVVWGALDLDVQEPWQNPSTNAAIRKSIVETAHEALREAVRTKRPLWSAANHLTVRIVLDDESHNLTLAPFCDSEACTVTHMQFVQSVFDQSGPERGILNLSQDPEATHAIPLGRIAPIEAYVCLKAHRQTRLTEVQLNYVHSKGLLKHKGFDTALLPEPEGLFLGKGLASNSSMPPTKSTRLSGFGVDVLASSYHLADQVYTTITVVRYPPFGTQFGAGPACVKSLHNRPRLSMPPLRAGTPDEDEDDAWRDSENAPPARPRRNDPDAVTLIWGAPRGHAPRPGEEHDESGGEEEDDDPSKPWNEGKREERPKDSPLLFRKGRKAWSIKIDEKGRPTHKPENWFAPLYIGQYYFIDGVFGDPYDVNQRLILFEANNGNVYKDAQNKAVLIRDDFLAKFHDVWNPQRSFYDNIAANDKIKTHWSRSWAEFLYEHIKVLEEEHNALIQQNGLPRGSPQVAFWYTHNSNIWPHIFKKDQTELDKELLLRPAQQIGPKGKHPEHQQLRRTQFDPNSIFGQKCLFYMSKPAEWLAHWIEHDKIAPITASNLINGLGSSCKGRAFPKTKMIPIPRAPPATKATQEAVRTLQSRICALETKLEKAQNGRNTQALLERVLERLEETD